MALRRQETDEEEGRTNVAGVREEDGLALALTLRAGRGLYFP